MKRSPLARRAQLNRSGTLTRTKRLTARTGLPWRSVKRADEMAEYRPARAAYLAANPRCHFPLGCNAQATQVHHKRGRRGRRLLDQRHWAAACDWHNDYAETQTGHSLDIGWLERIEGATP